MIPAVRLKKMYGKEHINNVAEAVSRLQESGIEANERTYGFSVEHRERQDGSFLQCGCEHDASVSAAVYDGTRPLRRFYRFDFLELADFIICAYSRATQGATCKELRDAMETLDSSYDHQSLKKALNHELEIRGIPPASQV